MKDVNNEKGKYIEPHPIISKKEFQIMVNSYKLQVTYKASSQQPDILGSGPMNGNIFNFTNAFPFAKSELVGVLKLYGTTGKQQNMIKKPFGKRKIEQIGSVFLLLKTMSTFKSEMRMARYCY